MNRRYDLVAIADLELENILLYVAAESGAAAADQLESEFHECMERIASVPWMGHTRTDLAGPELRFVSLHKFMIAYRPETTPVQIMRILHGSRDIESVFREDWPRPGEY